MRGGACSTHRFLRRLGRVISRVMGDILSSGAGHHVAVRRTATMRRRGGGGRPGGQRQGSTAPGRGGNGSRPTAISISSANRSIQTSTLGRASSLMKGLYPIYKGKIVVGNGATCNYSR